MRARVANVFSSTSVLQNFESVNFSALGKQKEGKGRGSCEAERIEESRTGSEVSVQNSTLRPFQALQQIMKRHDSFVAVFLLMSSL